MKATKKIKFSLGMKIVSILSCLAIVSVGFASWWIVNLPAEKATATGSFTVYSVSEKNITFGDVEGTDTAIIFGQPANTETKTTWLGKTKVENENLTAIISIPVTLSNSDDSSSDDKLADYVSSITVEFDAGAQYTTLVSSEYLADPTFQYSTDGTNYTDANATVTSGKTSFEVSVPTTEELKTATIYVKVTFGWGAVTGGANPYDYFNQKTATEVVKEGETTTYKDLAKAMLEAIHGLNTEMPEVSYTLKFSANAKSAS